MYRRSQKLEETFLLEQQQLLFPVISLYDTGDAVETSFEDYFWYRPPPSIEESSTSSEEEYMSSPQPAMDKGNTLLKGNKLLKLVNKNSHLNDLTIQSKDGQEVQCTRLILSFRSEVFRTMLQPEKKTGNRIHISEYNAATITKMIEFMYTDEVEEEVVDIDLLTIAHKYQMAGLQNLCEKILRSQL